MIFFWVIEFFCVDEYVIFLIFCYIVVLIIIFFGGVLNINILFVSIDKFVVIMSLFKYNIRVIEKIFIVSVVMNWVWLFVFVVLFFVGWGRVEDNVFLLICCFIMIFSGDYFIICFIFIYGILLIIIIIFYFFIFKVVF